MYKYEEIVFIVKYVTKKLKLTLEKCISIDNFNRNEVVMLGFRNKEIYYQDYYSELAKYNNLVQQTILKNRFLSLKIYEFETKESMYYEYKVVIDEKLTSYWYEYSLIDYEYNNRKSNYFISENGYFTYVNDVDINGEIDVRLKFFSYSYIKNKSQEDLTVEDVDIDLMIGLYFINEGFGSA